MMGRLQSKRYRLRASSFDQQGITIAEVVVASGIMAAVLALVMTVHVAARKQADLAMEVNEASRSVLLAVEAIRQDVGRLAFIEPEKDLTITEGGSVLTLQVPKPSRTEYWRVEYTSIQYSLERLPGPGEAYTLYRDDGGKSSLIGGCTLRSLRFRYVPPGELSAVQCYLEVSLVGMGSAKGQRIYVTSAVIPLPLQRLPEPFPVPEQES
jgi:type II secretory pathway pseudopilin PulG